MPLGGVRDVAWGVGDEASLPSASLSKSFAGVLMRLENGAEMPISKRVPWPAHTVLDPIVRGVVG